MAPRRPSRRRAARLLFASLLPSLAVAQQQQSPPPTTTDPAKAALQSTINAVRDAQTANDRAAILGGDGFSFSFLDAKFFGGGGDAGGVVLADDTLWPATIGTNSAMLMGFIGPCGMVAPHNHPRATEVLINVVGPPLEHGLIGENGSPPALSYAGPGNATVLPQGSMHYVANTGCDPTIIVAGFNAESPGVLFMSAAYNAFPTETYSAAFGDLAVEYLPTNQIPNTVIIGRESCLQKCGITRQNYKQYFDPSKFTSTEILMASMGAWLKSNNYQGFNGLANGPAPYQMASPVAMPEALMSSAPGFTGGTGGPYTPQGSGSGSMPNTANVGGAQQANANGGGPLPGFPYNQPGQGNRLSALATSNQFDTSGGNTGSGNGFYGGANQNSGGNYGSNMGSAYYGSQAGSNLLPAGSTNTGSSYYGSQGPPSSGGSGSGSGGSSSQFASSGGGSTSGMGGSNYQSGSNYQTGSGMQGSSMQGSTQGSNIPGAFIGYPGEQVSSQNGGMPANPQGGTGSVGASYYGSQYQSPPNPVNVGANQANAAAATPVAATKAKGFIPAVVILAILNAVIIAAVVAAFLFVRRKKKREADPFRSASVKGEKHSFKGGYGYPVDQKDRGDADDEKGHIIFHHDSRDDDPPPAPTDGAAARHLSPPKTRPRSVSSTHTGRSLADEPASRGDHGHGRRSGSH